MGVKPAVRKVKARYGAMTVFANDTSSVTSSLLLYREWAQHEIEFVMGLFEPGATVLDVGAYIGTHTLAFAHRVGASGVVHAFEAQPQSFGLLERNVAANHVHQVRLHQAAVCDAVGTIGFTPVDPFRKESFGSVSLAPILRAHGDAQPTRQTTVAATTIDTLNLDRCDFIKIDVEDSEDLVLKGAARTLDRCRPIVYAECNSVDAGVRIREILRSHGYELRLHLVLAFNPENFAGERQNIFGAAREAAILGVPLGRELPDGQSGSAEILLPIETTDDLVLGLLNKPQYLGEVLDKTAAARLTEPISISRRIDGEVAADNAVPEDASQTEEVTQAALEQSLATAPQQAIEQLGDRVRAMQAALESAQQFAAGQQAEAEELRDALGACRLGLGRAEARAAQYEQLAETAHAKADAAILQASLARRSAEAALAASREHERERERMAAIAAEHTAELERMRTTLHSAETTASEYKRELDRTRDTLALAELTVERIRSALTAAEAIASEQRMELEQTRSALVRAEAQDAEHTTELERMRHCFLQAEELVRERDGEIEQTRIALRRAEARANAVLGSTSWRLTAPVRGLGRLVRRR